jgi:hypothetical protein
VTGWLWTTELARRMVPLPVTTAPCIESVESQKATVPVFNVPVPESWWSNQSWAWSVTPRMWWRVRGWADSTRSSPQPCSPSASGPGTAAASATTSIGSGTCVCRDGSPIKWIRQLHLTLISITNFYLFIQLIVIIKADWIEMLHVF